MNTAVVNERWGTVPQAELDGLRAQIQSLSSQLDWFKRQLFGAKSEKRLVAETQDQASLFAPAPVTDASAPNTDAPHSVIVPAHSRRKHRTGEEVNDTGLRFNENVPVREIRLPCPELQGAHADRYEVIDHKVSLRLARQPGSHVVLKYLRPVVREKATGVLHSVPAPVGVLDHAQVDVSMLVGILLDKFVWHMPLYRQHLRLCAEGIHVSRAALDTWTHRTIDLLTPISMAVLQQVLSGAHIKIDETAIPAGTIKVTEGPRAGLGKVKQAWMWPILGEQGDIVFGFSAHRSLQALKDLIGVSYQGTIQTDGYSVYARYQAHLPLCIHALCWSHTRRAFLKAEKIEPEATKAALDQIRALYRIEQTLREQGADAHKILAHRQQYSAPIVQAFFEWVDQKINDPGLLPSNPLSKDSRKNNLIKF